MPVSSVPIRCCADYTGAGKCTVHGKDNKEDKTREEADMALSPVFPKVFQKCPRVVRIHILSIFDRFPYFGSLFDCFGHFWKNWAKGDVSLLPS